MEKVFEQIPDVWFDLYARLIPGFFFVLAISVFLEPGKLADHLLFVLLISYTAGHIVQPLSSAVARFLQQKIFDRKNNIKLCRERFAANSRESKLLSKQHAECACFAALAILSGLVLALFQLEALAHIFAKYDSLKHPIGWGLMAYFIVCALLRAHTVAERARSYQARDA